MATVTKRRSIQVAPILKSMFLVLIGLMYFIPLFSAAIFGFTEAGKGFSLGPLLDPLKDSTFGAQLATSFFLMIATAALSLALLLPTLVWLHLSAPKLLGVAEALSILPFVVPAIALVSGATFMFKPLFPAFMGSVVSLVPFYTILSLPLVYRALDTGLRSLDLRTLYDAATSLGQRPVRIITAIIIPNMSAAIIAAVLLTFIMALGEYVLAALLLHRTFPVFIVTVGQTYPKTAAALSTIVILGTWMIMAIMARLLKAITGQRPSLL